MTWHTWRTIGARAAIAGLAGLGLVACGPREPGTDVERLARGRELVQQMSARLAAAAGVRAKTTEVRDLVRASGAKERVSLTSEYTLRRPDRFHTRMTGGRGLELWYDGKDVTVAAHEDKVFAQAPMPETIDRALDAVSERYDLGLPLADLFRSAPDKALLSDTTTGGYVGVENVGQTPCHHLAFRDVGVEWELWLPVQGEPLPTRLKVRQTARTGTPMTDVTFTAWTFPTPIGDATFVPNVPADYEGVAMIQRAAAVKDAAASPEPAPPAKE